MLCVVCGVAGLAHMRPERLRTELVICGIVTQFSGYRNGMAIVRMQLQLAPDLHDKGSEVALAVVELRHDDDALSSNSRENATVYYR